MLQLFEITNLKGNFKSRPKFGKAFMTRQARSHRSYFPLQNVEM